MMVYDICFIIICLFISDDAVDEFVKSFAVQFPVPGRPDQDLRARSEFWRPPTEEQVQG